jgi:hypothetical protein
MPPRAGKLLKLAEAGQFPPPRLMEIHTGAEDNECDPELARKFSSLVLHSKTFVVAGAGHQLAAGYVTQTLTRFLVSSII